MKQANIFTRLIAAIFIAVSFLSMSAVYAQVTIYFPYGSSYPFGSYSAGTAGTSNCFIGYQTGTSAGSGPADYNTFVGTYAGQSDQYSETNTFLGYKAGQFFTNSATYEGDGENVFVGGNCGLAFGNNPYSSSEDNYANVAIGFNTAMSAGGDNNIYLGAYAGENSFWGEGNIFIGIAAGQNANSSQWSIAIGNGAGANDAVGDNIFMGNGAGFSNTSGTRNVFIGTNAGTSNTTGGSVEDANASVYIGYDAGIFSNGSPNTFTGYNAGYNNTSGNYNCFYGDNTGYNNGSGTNNSFFGSTAGQANANGTANTFIGQAAGAANANGVANTFVGEGAGATGSSGNANVFVGYQAGNVNTASDNQFIGYQAGINNTTGGGNIFEGIQAAYHNVSGSNNLYIGNQVANQSTADNDNTYIGNFSGQNANGASNNTLIGYNAGNYLLTGSYNTLLGHNVGASGLQTGGYNVYLGIDDVYGVLGDGSYNTCTGVEAFSGGSYNSQYGYKAGYGNTGSNNVFFGELSGTNSSGAISTGNYNVIIGVNAGALTTGATGCTGDNNVFIGQNSGAHNAGGATNVALGYNADVNGGSSLSNATALGNGASVTNSNSMVFGNGAVTSWGLGLNTPHAFEINPAALGGSGQFYIDPTELYYQNNGGGNLVIGGNTFVYSASGGSFSSSPSGFMYASDRNLKENFTAVNYDTILSRIDKLDIPQWNYKGDSTKTKHIGPIAQDFKRIFNIGKDSTSVCVIDPSGVALAAIKGLIGKNKQLDSANSTMQTKMATITTQNAQLQQTVDAQSAQIADQNNRLAGLEEKMEQLATMQEQCCMAANPPSLGGSNNTNATLQDNTSQSARLDQNMPNPFDGSTTIGYFIPANVQSAVISISTQMGQIIKTFVITGRGNGQVEFESATIAAGTYFYNLVLDGKQADSKKMIIVKE